MTAVPLSLPDLALESVLMLANVAASLLLRWQLHREFLWASARMVVQLLLVGLVLRIVFKAASPLASIVVAMLMIAAAAREVAVRPTWGLKGLRKYYLSTSVVSVAGSVTVVLALMTAIRPSPWYDPRYAIPLLGIVLGSVLNSATIALDSFFDNVVHRRAAVEAQLALGYPIFQALAEPIRTAIRRGMIPIINQMSAAGVITLPGIMTGQLIAGMDPVDAAKYQILLLFLLGGAGGLAAAGAVYLAARSVTDVRQRLRLDHLDRRGQ